MAEKSRPTRPTYHLELGAEGTDAFFVVTRSVANRIEIVSIALDYVLYRVVYFKEAGDCHSYLFGFRFKQPFIYKETLRDKLRLSEETYRQLYRLADILMRAYLYGYHKDKFLGKKAYQRIQGGDRFRIRRLAQYAFTVQVNEVDYTFSYQLVSEDIVMYPPLGIENLDEHTAAFLTGFARIIFMAYMVYERKPGRMLEDLYLFPELQGQEPVRWVRNMWNAERTWRLEAIGKPPFPIPAADRGAPLSQLLLFGPGIL